MTNPDEVCWGAETPVCSAEGYRVIWIRSSDKRARDAATRSERIERARAAIGDLAVELDSPRCKTKSLVAVEETATGAIADAGAARWVRAHVSDSAELERRQEWRGRPGKDTRYRRIEHHRFSAQGRVDAAADAYDAASDGCFPFVSNLNVPPAALLKMRRAMLAKAIPSLPLYYEDRACATPTAARVFRRPLRRRPVACVQCSGFST